MIVNYAVTESVFEAFYYDRRYVPSFSQKRLVEAGFLGKKSKRGFYDYREGAVAQKADKDLLKGEEILQRILSLLINEAADALLYGVASEPDIELAMCLGVNYPKGLIAWARDTGIQTCVQSTRCIVRSISRASIPL